MQQHSPKETTAFILCVNFLVHSWATHWCKAKTFSTLPLQFQQQAYVLSAPIPERKDTYRRSFIFQYQRT